MQTFSNDKEFQYSNKDFSLSNIAGSNCNFFMKDKNDKIIASLDVCNEKIMSVGYLKGDKLSAKSKQDLIKFIKEKKIKLSISAAKDLGLSIFEASDGKEYYERPFECSILI